MRLRVIFAAAFAGLTTIAPTYGQSLLETKDEAARRRQAEQYQYEKSQERQGNFLNTEKPRGLGEAPPAGLSNPRGRTEPNPADRCPSWNPNCR